jgi:hypothetical protein
MFAESNSITVVIDVIAAGTLATAIAGAIYGHARTIVGYLERRDTVHTKAVETITTQFREDVKENRAEVSKIVDRLIEGQETNRADIDRLMHQAETPPSASGVRRKPPTSGV